MSGRILGLLGSTPAGDPHTFAEFDEPQDVELMTARVMESVRPGSILLFHDGGRDKPGTLKTVDLVLEKLQAQGYRFVTVHELLTLAQPEGSAPSVSSPGAGE